MNSMKKRDSVIKRNNHTKKSEIKKIWEFIWHSDSPWSWLVNILLAFLIIKFLVYPGLGLVFGTNLPIVAVISNSMEHPQGNDWFFTDSALCYNGPCVQMEWYMQHNISEEIFNDFRFTSGFNKGDLMILVGSSPKDTNIGDVIVFYRPDGIPVIHRVFDKYNLSGRVYYSTKGDNNIAPLTPQQAGFDENQISSESVAGKAIGRVPFLGWIKLAFTNLISSIFGVQLA